MYNNYSIENKNGKTHIYFKKPLDKIVAPSIIYSELLNSCSINTTFTTLSFYANKTQCLEDYLTQSITSEDKHVGLTYNQVVRLIFCIKKQQDWLMDKKGCGFYTFDSKHILVIDNYTFIYISSETIRPIIHKCFIFTSPFIKNKWCSTEILNIHDIPNTTTPIDYWIFSLSMISFYCLFYFKYKNIEEKDTLGDVVLNNQTLFFENNIDAIKYTKLYWFYKRALHSNPIKRSLLML